jgi:hypothetical protein
MSYTLTLACGCTVYVACAPDTGVPHSRILELHGRQCADRWHEAGRRLHLWELLPDPDGRVHLQFHRERRLSA